MKIDAEELENQNRKKEEEIIALIEAREYDMPHLHILTKAMPYHHMF